MKMDLSREETEAIRHDDQQQKDNISGQDSASPESAAHILQADLSGTFFKDGAWYLQSL